MGMLSRNLPALRVLRSVLYLVNLNSAGLALMGCLAVGACERWGLRFALDSSIVVFGITFSVGPPRRAARARALRHAFASRRRVRGRRRRPRPRARGRAGDVHDHAGVPAPRARADHDRRPQGVAHRDVLAPQVRPAGSGCPDARTAAACAQPTGGGGRGGIARAHARYAARTRARARPRDWAQGPGYPEATVGNDNTPWAREVAAVILEFLDNLQRYIVTDEGYESVAEMRLAAKRNSTAQLMMGNTSLAHESLGLSFISRWGPGRGLGCGGGAGGRVRARARARAGGGRGAPRGGPACAAAPPTHPRRRAPARPRAPARQGAGHRRQPAGPPLPDARVLGAEQAQRDGRVPYAQGGLPARRRGRHVAHGAVPALRGRADGAAAHDQDLQARAGPPGGRERGAPCGHRMPAPPACCQHALWQAQRPAQPPPPSPCARAQDARDVAPRVRAARVRTHRAAGALLPARGPLRRGLPRRRVPCALHHVVPLGGGDLAAAQRAGALGGGAPCRGSHPARARAARSRKPPSVRPRPRSPSLSRARRRRGSTRWTCAASTTCSWSSATS